MNQLYVYGCSFSYASLVYSPFIDKWRPFYQTQFHEYAWANQVANHYNMPLQMKALGGVGNETMISRILEDQQNFKEGDKVVIGISRGSRLSLEHFRREEENKLFASYPDVNQGCINMMDIGWIDHLGEFFKTGRLSEFSRDEFELLMLYAQTWRLKPEEDDALTRQQTMMYESLSAMLYRDGIEVYLWDPTCWKHFQNITTWLEDRKYHDERIEDGHWSPNGNTSFSAFVIHCMENDIPYWNESTCLRYKETAMLNYISGLLPTVPTNFELDTSWFDLKKYTWIKDNYSIYKYATGGSK
tara:strand:+ start:146 stop:1045 length:900 start_codon:yes stop_codon:yes gene_type:complete